MDEGAQDDVDAAMAVLAHTRRATLAEAVEILGWICAMAPDDLSHVRHGAEADVVLVGHAGEKHPRAVVLTIEAWTIICRALGAC